MTAPVRDDPDVWWDEAPPAPRGPRLRTWVISLVAAAAVGSGIGALSLTGGSGGVPGADQIPAIPASSASAAAAAGSPATPQSVTSFDPLAGGSGFATSGTTFVTQHYHSAAFSGLKPGVGLVADFGKPVSISSVTFATSVAGTTVQVLAGDSPPAGDSPLASASAPATPTATPTGTTTVRTTTTTPHRYWMLWVTQLGSDGQGGWWDELSRPAFTGA